MSDEKHGWLMAEFARAKKRMEKVPAWARPEWVKDHERTDDGSLLVVEGHDGVLRGVRLQARSWERPE